MSADGAVPIAHRLVDGSTEEDSTTHVETWDALVAVVGTPGFTYVADCKLATRDNLDHIASRGGRFLTILPRTRKEDETGRAWIAGGEVQWQEIARAAGRRKADPEQLYWAAEAPTCSAEGHRIVWIRSSDKRVRDALARSERIERARAALGGLAERLESGRSKMKSLAAVEEAAAAALGGAGASRWVHAEVTDTVELEHRQERRGRPGANTPYRRIEHHRYALAASVDAAAVAYDAASDGCFPFVTNEKLSAAELLRMYKTQPHLERRHATFKGVIEAAPLTLKSDARIDALGLCLYVALLVHALVERDLRRAMAAQGIRAFPSTTRTGPARRPARPGSSSCWSRCAPRRFRAPGSWWRSSRRLLTRSSGRSWACSGSRRAPTGSPRRDQRLGPVHRLGVPRRGPPLSAAGLGHLPRKATADLPPCPRTESR